MKNLCLSILFLISSFFGWSQDSGNSTEEPILGKIFSTPRKSNFSGFLGRNDLTIFSIDYVSISRKKQELMLRRFNANTLELVDSRNLFTVIDDAYYNEPQEIFYRNDSIYLFSTLNGLKQNHNLVYLEIFNQYGERLSGKTIDTLSTDEKYYLTESVEKEGFLMATHNPYDNIFEQTLNLMGIDVAGNTTWENSVKSGFSISNLSIEQLYYSVHMPVFILCNYGFNRGNGSVRNTQNDLIDNKYALWAYDYEGIFLKEFDLRVKNKWINGVKLKMNKANELIISGFLNETRNQSINGVFSLIISPDLTVKNSSYYTYKRSFYEKFVNTKQLDKTKELDDILIRNCVVLQDNSFFLLGEHYYKYTERNYDPRTNITTTTDNYNYNSIIVTHFDKNGNHQWTERIPKFQHSINDYGYYSSFGVMHYQNEIYLYFNDSDRNNELAYNDYFNYRGLSNNRRFQITEVRIGTDGVRSRQPIISTDNDFNLRAKPTYQIEDDFFYLYGENGRNRRIFKVPVAPAN